MRPPTGGGAEGTDMMHTRNTRLTLLAVVVLALVVMVQPAAAAPAAQTNLLTNGGFEAGSLSNWTAWAVTLDGGSTDQSCQNWSSPTFEVSGASPHGGSYAAHYYTTFASHNAGLYQQVDATPGTTYNFTIYGMAISKAAGSGSSEEFTNMWVGIDPRGGTDASAGTVVWAGPWTPMDGYGVLSVQAAAVGEKVTVFTRSTPNWCLEVNEVYWDDASLTASGSSSGESATTAEPGAVATSPVASEGYIVATPDANGRIVHTVQEGDMLGTIASLYGVTNAQLREWNNLDSDLIVLGSQLIVNPGDGSAEAASADSGDEAAAEATQDAEAPLEMTPVEGEGDAELTAEDEAPLEATQLVEAPEAEATDEAEVAEAAGPAMVCVMSYNDTNGNGIRDPQEAKVGGVKFLLNTATTLLGQYTADGVNEPYCFSDLDPGTYTVSWEGEGYEATSEQSWTVELTPGEIQDHEFGVVPPAEVNETAESNGSSALGTAVVGALIIVLVLSAIGAGVYFFYLKPRQA